MSIPRKGSRRIIVNGNEFIWKIKKYPSHNERHNVEYLTPVQHAEGGQILLISLGYCRSGYQGAKMFSITPSILERCIKYAITEGWQFREKLPPLNINCNSILREEAVSLTNKIINGIKQHGEDNPICTEIVDRVKSILDAGEYNIALEIIVENICEYDVRLSRDVIDFATQAFAIYGNEKYALILKKIKILE